MLRHALWNVNVEHGQTIIRTSGSPICAYGHDFNPAILDERAGFVFFGKYILYLGDLQRADASSGCWSTARSRPGSTRATCFSPTTPGSASTHQPDVILAGPYSSTAGCSAGSATSCTSGTSAARRPGGFNPMAQDVFWEAPVIPPVKIVEGGELRRDVEEMYVRNSRLPQLVDLDLRAQITGCHVARDGSCAWSQRYGASTVKATMRKRPGRLRHRLRAAPGDDPGRDVDRGGLDGGQRSPATAGCTATGSR